MFPHWDKKVAIADCFFLKEKKYKSLYIFWTEEFYGTFNLIIQGSNAPVCWQLWTNFCELQGLEANQK